MVSSVESQTHWSAVMSIGLLYNLVRLLVVRQIDCEEGHAEIGESFVKIAVVTEYMVCSASIASRAYHYRSLASLPPGSFSDPAPLCRMTAESS